VNHAVDQLPEIVASLAADAVVAPIEFQTSIFRDGEL
jgi:hypothetical protein